LPNSGDFLLKWRTSLLRTWQHWTGETIDIAEEDPVPPQGMQLEKEANTEASSEAMEEARPRQAQGEDAAAATTRDSSM
jgi:hypothetical protein